MSSQTKAVIDVGTNSVKLLIAEVSEGNVEPVLETSRQTRLGKGLYKNHRLQSGAIDDTVQAVFAFLRNARDSGAQGVRVIATSAARDAQNVEELVGAIHESSGLDLEVISGDEEAELIFRGVQSGIADDGPVMIVDVGGGSTEIIVGHAERLEFHRSYQLGTVRLMERCPHSDPPTLSELVEVQDYLRKITDESIRPDLARAITSKAGLKLIGTGGTSTLLARIHNQMDGFDRKKIESTVLTGNLLQELGRRLWSMSLRERSAIVGLPAQKADVILLGIVIFESLLRLSSCDKINVSLRGLRFGALLGCNDD